MAEITAVRGTAVASAALVLLVALSGCAGTSDHSPVQRIVVCAGPDDQHPAGTPVEITLRQGGRQVARASTQAGTLVALIVPEAPTAVLVDGERMGSVGWDGREADATADPRDAPDDAALRAAAATDPDDVKGFIGLTGPGCPPTSQADLG